MAIMTQWRPEEGWPMKNDGSNEPAKYYWSVGIKYYYGHDQWKQKPDSIDDNDEGVARQYWYWNDQAVGQ